MNPPFAPPLQPGRIGLGIDAGGTATRWALCAADGTLLRDGSAPGFSALQLGTAEGRGSVAAVLGAIADGVADTGPLHAATAGVTGFDAAQAPQLQQLLMAAFGLPPHAVQALSDIELACRAAFAPGGGIVVYAGTGAVAAFLAADGTLHRAGGRGVLIDDAGGGHWIACQALRHVWRAEDAAPGAWRTSALAQRLFAQIGGSDWAATRAHVYGQASADSRGAVGMLALAVAAAARDGDAAALQILHAAGGELARLACALLQRDGLQRDRPLPLAFAGRAFALHSAVEAGLRAALPAGAVVAGAVTQSPQHAAAVLAARMHPGQASHTSPSSDETR